MGISANPLLFHQFGVNHLTHENGLANNTILEIYQDKTGFLWLGTDVGITRYDGVHFHNYDLPENGFLIIIGWFSHDSQLILGDCYPSFFINNIYYTVNIHSAVNIDTTLTYANID